MFIQIDKSVDEEVLCGHTGASEFLDDVINAHRLGNLLLVLSRAQLARYRECTTLSHTSRRMLGLLSTRLNDYKAALRSASRSVIVCSPSHENNYRVEGSIAWISYRLLDSHNLHTQKFFLAEGRRDIDLIGMLAEEYYNIVRYPRAYVTFRPLLGGGGALHHVLESETVTPARGFVVCDRDACVAVPPFGHNTTGQKALSSAQQLGLIGDSLGLSDTSPFFGFQVTWGRTIENMVGPHMLESYFVSMNRKAERATITAAFPDFPTLNPSEQLLWRYLNLKGGTPILTEQLTALREAFGSVPAPILARLGPISAAVVPADTIDWLIDNRAARRWTASLKSAIALDLANPTFRQAVEALALPLLTLAAGDGTARRS